MRVIVPGKAVPAHEVEGVLQVLQVATGRRHAEVGHILKSRSDIPAIQQGISKGRHIHHRKHSIGDVVVHAGAKAIPPGNDQLVVHLMELHIGRLQLLL